MYVVLVNHGILSNTAHLKSMNGVEKLLDSETTWYEAQPAVLSVKKTGIRAWPFQGRPCSFLIPKAWLSMNG